MEDIEVKTVSEFGDLDDATQRNVIEAVVLGEKLRHLIIEECKAGRVSQEAAWNAAFNHYKLVDDDLR